MSLLRFTMKPLKPCGLLSYIIGLGDSAEITSNWLDLRDAEKGDRVYASESVVDMDKGQVQIQVDTISCQ